eukprot:6209567-Pleurochrysis_carterae.AAC.1
MLADDEYEVRLAALLFCRELLQQARPASMRVKHKRADMRQALQMQEIVSPDACGRVSSECRC